MQRSIRVLIAGVAVAACGHGKSEKSAAGNVVPPSSPQTTAVPGPSYNAPPAGVDTTTASPKHHSKLAGAAAGAAAGHVLGGHSVAGAAAGALYQHERNKHKK